MTADPHARVRRRVEERLTRHVGRNTRVGGEADRLILAIRDEGTAVRYLEINGTWEDHIRYAITAEEWAERREQLVKEWLE